VAQKPLRSARSLLWVLFSKFQRTYKALFIALRKYGIFLWILVVLLALSLFLHIRFGLVWEHRPLATEQIQKGIGYPGVYAYSIPLGTIWLNHDKWGSSAPAQVTENGVPLAFPDCLHAEIADKGAGRYSLWAGNLFFSTSDNTDARTNGRKYELYWPKPIPVTPAIIRAVILLLILVTILMGWSYWSSSQKIIPSARSLFWVSCGIVTLAFVLARLPWLLDFPLPFLQYDTSSYFRIIRRILAGNWPIFSWRTPGYPIFLALALGIVPKLMFVIALQCALSLCSALFLLYAIYKTCGRLVIFAAIAVTAHVTQQFMSGLDVVVITESLFTSLFLFFLGFLFLGTWKPRKSTLLAAPLLGACAILVRPAGIFIFGCIIIACLYLLLTRIKLKYILCLGLPIPFILLILLTYNYFTFSEFSMSQVSGYTRWAITAIFWEPDDSFPPEINESIKKLSAEIPDEDRRIALQSWDIEKIQNVNLKWSAYVCLRCLYIPGKLYNSNPKYYSMVAKKATKAHPAGAIRIFVTTLLGFLDDQSSYKINLYNDVSWVLKQMYVEGTATDPFIGREFSSFPPIRTLEMHIAPDGQKSIKINDSKLRGKQLYIFLLWFNQIAFDTTLYKGIKLWTAIYFIIFAISFVRVLQTRFRHWGSFILFTTCSCLLGAGLVIALTTTMTNRYPSPTRFIEVLSLALVPLLWRKEKEAVSNHTTECVPTGNRGEEGMIRNTSAIGNMVHNYYQWNLSVFPIERGKRILDIGCGPCLYLEAILAYDPEIYLATDYSENFLDMARKRMRDLPKCHADRLDILNTTGAIPLLLGQKFDYVLCFDVIEHLPDDISALKNIREIMLATSARNLFIRVPALPLIYGRNDAAIGHYRRYTKKGLRKALASAGFKVGRMKYQNIAGIIPWFMIGRFFQRSLAVAPGEGRLFDILVPGLRRIENILAPPFGLSVYCETTPIIQFTNRKQDEEGPDE
jgi:SAM-dependent methyltransferase